MKRKLTVIIAMSILSMGIISCGKENNMEKTKTEVETIAISNQNNTNATKNLSEDYVKTKSPTNPHLRKLSGKVIEIKAGGKTLIVDLYDNPTAEDLVSKLPINLKISDYPGYDEKVIRLQKKLSMKGAPKSDEPAIPELGYYEPGNWIAIYYGYIGNWPGKVPLGQIRTSIEEISNMPGDADVTVRLVK